MGFKWLNFTQKTPKLLVQFSLIWDLNIDNLMGLKYTLFKSIGK